MLEIIELILFSRPGMDHELKRVTPVVSSFAKSLIPVAFVGCAAFADASFTGPDLFDTDGGSAGDVLFADVVLEAGGPKDGRGNPLCNATTASCFPDDERPLQCNFADAGADAGAHACRVAQTSSTPMCSTPSVDAKGENASCMTGADCVAGFECVGLPSACRHYCCDETTCDAYGKLTQRQLFCDVQPLASYGKKMVPVCQQVVPCNLHNTLQNNDTCGPNEQCSIVKVNMVATTSCVAKGTAIAGDDCTQQHCAAGLVCVGAPATCHQLCDPKMPGCGASETCFNQWPVLSSQGVGFCQ